MFIWREKQEDLELLEQKGEAREVTGSVEFKEDEKVRSAKTFTFSED